MPVYMCNGCHPEHPCVLFAEGEFPLPDKCPWGSMQFPIQGTLSNIKHF